MNDNRRNILEKLKEIAGEFVGSANLLEDDEKSLEEVDGWSSFTHVNVLLRLEEEFKIRFATEDISSIDNIKILIDKIITKNN